MTDYQPHELAEVIPEMSPEEYVELREDIRNKGLLVPIVLWEGKILDGRHRFKACIEAGIEVTFREFHVNGIGPLEFVISQNLMRRHLSRSQRAAIAVTLKDKILEVRKTIPTGPKRLGSGLGRASHHVAKAMKVGVASVDRATKVRNAKPELFKEVAEGKTSLNHAYFSVKTAKPRLIRKSQLKDKVIDAPGEAIALIHGLECEGWSCEMNREDKRWTVHFYGNGEAPYTEAQWAKAPENANFVKAVSDSARAIQNKVFEDA